MRFGRMIQVVGCHAAGEIGDVITGGVLPPTGATMFDKMRTMEREHDHIRRLLLCEPRGSVARHVNLLVPPTRPDCDAGAIIMEPTEYVPMSGSNTICIVTVLLETGILPMAEPTTVVTLDMPGGVVKATAHCSGGKVTAPTCNTPWRCTSSSSKLWTRVPLTSAACGADRSSAVPHTRQALVVSSLPSVARRIRLHSSLLP